ncbi:tetratricopeptide repeat protein [Tautonia sociabilis]|uniref:Tetratricopeptide repeat protein n=1 Tax=Tautonia sociabilis TaxID=2080755 RepID=A0A432MLQ4_9BACT|nr:tetratricopeptide repeat protein [Tautonia sociabilis]RUL88137.1 tetratricopeptide repeat protein [Tautonia sociabilis]
MARPVPREQPATLQADSLTPQKPVRPRIASVARVFGLIAGFGLLVLATRLWRPEAPDSLLQRAQDAYRAGQHDLAESLLDRLARIREPNPLDRLLRAQVALATDRPEAALDELSRIPDDHPIAPISRLLQGQVAIRLGRAVQAESSFLRAIELQPRHVQARRELCFIYSIQRRLRDLDLQLAALAELGELTPSYVLHWSKIRNVNWNYEKDLEHLRRFVAEDPTDRRSRLTLAEAIKRSGDLAEADRLLAPLPRSDPEAAALRASIAIERGDLNAASEALVEAPPDHPAVARSLGEIALIRLDPETALPSLRIAVRHDPSDRLSLFLLGRALSLLGRDEEAAPILETVRQNDLLGQMIAQASAKATIDDPELCLEIGLACQRLSRPLEARAWFDIALLIDPFHERAQEALALLDDGQPPLETTP